MANNGIIQLVIQAKNEASKVLKAVEKDAQAVQRNAAKTNPAPSVDATAAGATVAGIAAVGVALGVAANEAAHSAALFERLEYSTNSLGAQYGLSASEIISAVDGIAQGTLSNTTILEQANKAMLLGVANSTEEFETLTKIAIDRGRAMGISMEDAFNSIVLGVGRLSPLILDNLGIILDADKTYGAFAETLGKTADKLTDAEKRQALLGRLKEEMGSFDSSSVLDAASAWERFSSAVENTQIAFGGFINNSGIVINFINDMTSALDGASANFTLWNPKSSDEEKIAAYKHQITQLQEQLNYYNSSPPFIKGLLDSLGQMKIYEDGIVDLRLKISELESGMKGSTGGSVVSSFDKGAAAAAVMAVETMRAAAEQENLASATSNYAKNMGVTKAEAEWLAATLIKMYGSVEQATAAMNGFNAQLSQAAALANAVAGAMSGAYSSLETAAVQAYKNSGYNGEILTLYQAQLGEMKQIEESLVQQGVSTEMLPFAVAEATDGYTEVYDTINKAATATEKTVGGTKQLTAEFSSLKGIVGQIFSGLYDDIGGVSVDDFLPREDAPNEAARRIADVMVKGFESPWAEYFKTSFPDLFSQYMGSAGGDVKTAAAQLLRDFQSGLRPELIDTSAIKEIAKRMFQADEATSSMIDQVARELAAEMGISIEKATGYVSGAAGKTGIVDQAAIDAAKEKLKLSPSFTFGTAKDDLVAAGKAAGFFTETGAIDIPATVSISSIALDSGSLPTVELSVSKFILGATKEEITSQLSNDVGDVQIYTVFNMSKTTEDISTFGAQLSTAIGDVPLKITLAIPQMTDVEAFKQEIMVLAGQIGVPIKPILYGDYATSILEINAVFREALTNTSATDPIAIDFTNNLMGSFANQAGLLSLQGGAMAGYLYAGFAAYPLGITLAFEVSRQIGEAQSSFENSGKNAGKKWGNAFLNVVGENVPIELLQILVDLITPEVQKKLADEGSRK